MRFLSSSTKSNIQVNKSSTSFSGAVLLHISSTTGLYSKYALSYKAQVRQNWFIGQKLVVQEQKGKDRAEYGKHVIKIASEALTEEFGNGYSETNLKSFRKFYLTFKDYAIGQTVSAQFEDTKRQALITQSDKAIQQTLPAILSWSHYERLMRIKDKIIRDWYMKEAAEQMWNFRTLNRNINCKRLTKI